MKNLTNLNVLNITYAFASMWPMIYLAIPSSAEETNTLAQSLFFLMISCIPLACTLAILFSCMMSKKIMKGAELVALLPTLCLAISLVVFCCFLIRG